MTAKKIIKANSLINKFLKATYGKYLTKKYHISADKAILKDLQPPYLILGNHTNHLDPFFVGSFVEHPVHFVASDEHFRNPVKKFLNKYLLGAIPKTKFISDVETIKHIMKLVKRNCVIGMFPDGMCSWDGRTGQIPPSTAKLIKKLKIPIVICRLEGAYLSHPPWAIRDRRGGIFLNFKALLTPEMIGSMTVEQLYDELRRLLDYDEYERQRINPITYRGAKPAEKLERFLFVCPQCHAVSDLHSQKTSFYCRACNYQVIYTESGYFQPANGKLIFADLQEWNHWQLRFLSDLIRRLSAERRARPFSGTKRSGFIRRKGAGH